MVYLFDHEVGAPDDFDKRERTIIFCPITYHKRRGPKHALQGNPSIFRDDCMDILPISLSEIYWVGSQMSYEVSSRSTSVKALANTSQQIDDARDYCVFSAWSTQSRGRKSKYTIIS